MRIFVKKKDVIWNYLGTALSMSINFIMLPFLLIYLDDNSIGLWYLFQSIGGISILFDFGFDPTFGRNIAYCWSGAKRLEKVDVNKAFDDEVDYYLLKTIIETCKWIYFIISTILLIVLLLFGTSYIVYVTADLYDISFTIAWFIYAVGIFLNMYYGYYISCLRGVGAISEVNRAMICGRMLQIVLTIILLYQGYGLIGASMSYVSYGMVFRVIAKYKFLKYENIGEKIKAIKTKVPIREKIDIFRIVWYNAWRDGLVSVANYLANQATVIICSMFLSLSETGIYSISIQLTQGISTLAIAIFSVYQPSLQSCYVRREINRVREIFSFVIVMYIALFIFGSLFLCTLGISIIRLVKPDIKIMLNLLILLLIYQFMLKLRNCYTSYLSCTNRVLYGKAFIFSAILGILLAIILMKYCKMGVWGLPVAQIIAQMAYNMWKWPCMVNKELDLSIGYILRYGGVRILQSIKIVFKKYFR